MTINLPDWGTLTPDQKADHLRYLILDLFWLARHLEEGQKLIRERLEKVEATILESGDESGGAPQR